MVPAVTSIEKHVSIHNSFFPSPYLYYLYRSLLTAFYDLSDIWGTVFSFDLFFQYSPCRSLRRWTPCLSAESRGVEPSRGVGSCSESRCRCPAVRSYWRSSPSAPGWASARPPEPASPTKSQGDVTDASQTGMWKDAWCVEETANLGEGCRCHLNPAFVRCIYLQVMSVGAVQP